MEYDLVIKNGVVVLEQEVVRKHIGIRGEKICALLDNEAWQARKTLDADGCFVLPGAIDTHTHFFDPGANYREDFSHGTRAAASGGFTCIMEMPNSDPAVTDLKTFLLKKRLAEKGAVIDYAIWAGATASNLDHLDELQKAGCIAYKAFTLDAGPTFPWLNAELQMQAMKKIRKLDRVLGFHAEDPIIISERKNRFHNQPWTLALHEAARPYYAELNAINQIVLFSKETGCPAHICHLSIPEGAALIKKAKQDGVDITAESCSHYFLLNLENAAIFDTYALIQPPLRSKERMEQMWDYLMDGTIDYLGTDHAPYPACDKEPAGGSKWDVIGGAPSIDVAFPLMFEEAVLKRGMSLLQFSRLSSVNSAKRFGLYPQKGSIRTGADGDLVILDPHASWTVDRRKSFSKTKSTRFPYQGSTINCKVKATIVRGTIVFQNDSILVQDGYGAWVRPHTERGDSLEYQ